MTSPSASASSVRARALGRWVVTWWQGPPRPVELHPPRWRAVLVWALVGWVVGLALFVADYRGTVDRLGPLVVTEPIIPAAPVLEADLGPEAVNRNGPHDGAFFYVIAREPMHPTSAAEGLDRPRYRLQRILFPVLGWALHPAGGGEGLVTSLFVVGALGVLAGAVAMGALATSLGGPPWPAAIFPLLSGSLTSLRITTPDPLAVALAMLAVLAAMRRRTGWAVALAVAAVLTKETTMLVLLGWALWDRSPLGARLVVVPAAVAGAWWVVLRAVVPDNGRADVIEFTLPFQGWVRSVEHWSTGRDQMGMVWFALAVLLGVAAVALARPRHPLWGVVLANLLITVPLIASAVAPDRSAGRTTLALVSTAIVVLVTTSVGRSPEGATSESNVRSPRVAGGG